MSGLNEKQESIVSLLMDVLGQADLARSMGDEMPEDNALEEILEAIGILNHRMEAVELGHGALVAIFLKSAGYSVPPELGEQLKAYLAKHVG